MSTIRVSYRTCNGCNRGEHQDEPIEIVESRPYNEWAETRSDGRPIDLWERTIDLCFLCQERGRYICRDCRSVHDDEHPCDAVRARQAEAS